MTLNFLKSVSSIDWLRPLYAAFSRLTRRQHTRGASFVAGFVLCLVASGPAVAGPEGGVIRGGDGTITDQGLLTLIRQNSDRLAIDWESFNVGANETVRFVQPGSTSVALNRIFDQNPSQIFGVIEANGRVILINPNGMLFGETAQLNVAGLVASTLSISVDDFMNGDYTLEGTDEGGLILNRGTINSDYVALIGEAVANEGLIVADAGVVHLAAGRKVAIDFDGGGLMFFESDSEILSSALDVEAAVSNSGTIIADGGRVLLTADAARDVYSQAINNSGVIEARRIDNTGGVIRLSGGAGDTISTGTLDASGDANSDGGSIHVLGHNVGLTGDAVLDASGGRNGGQILIGGAFQGGDATIQNAHRTYVGSGVRIHADAGVVGDGGEVIVWADDVTRYFGNITARGGSDGGNGGFAEVSGANTLNFRGDVDLSATFGANGTLLLDPDVLTILGGDGGGSTALDGSLPDVDFGEGNANDAVTADALEGVSGTIVLEAGTTIVVGDQNLNGGDGSIDLSNDTDITLRTRNNSTDGDSAGGISFDDSGDSIIASGTGSITFESGIGGNLTADLTNIGNLQSDSGTISLSANNDIGLAGGLTSASGDINLSAGGSITIPSGASVVGGNVSIRVDDDDDSAETLTVAGTVTGTSAVALAGSATDSNDTLQAGDGANNWNVTAANAGTLNGLAFGDFENLTGGAGVDTFAFDVNDDGGLDTVDGLGGNDLVTYSGAGGPVTVAIERFDNIETLRGSGNAGDTLQGTNGANTFTVDGLNSGTADGVNYFEFENINGLGGNDTFTLNPGGSVSSINGGGGFDTIIGLGAASNVFVVTAVGAGTANGIAFDVIDNLTGGAASDTFTFNALLPGIASGGAGDDTFTFNAGGDVGLIRGGAGVDEIVGNDAGNTFVVNGADAGMVNGDNFVDVENLTGGSGDDTFTLNGALSGNLTGGAGDDVFNLGSGGSAAVIDGGAGTDEIDGGDGGNFFVVTAADAGTANGSAFFGIENLFGGAGADTFTLNASLSGSVAGEGGNDIIDVAGGGTAADYDGGAGTDTLVGSAGSNTFNVTAANAGDLNGVAFANMENLTGGAGADTFNFNAALGGTASGGAGDDTFNVNDGGSAFFFSGGTGNDLLSFAARTAGATINTSESGTIENILGSDFDDVINLSGNQSNGLSIDGGTGTDSFAVTANSTLGGDLSVTNVESAAVDAVITANNVTLDVDGAITRNGGGIIAQSLTTASVGGQDIQAAVGTFNATNTGGGDILLAGAGGVDIAGVTQSGGGDVDIVSDGSVAQTGNITSDGGDVSLTVIDGSLTMSAGTETTSNGGDIDYSTIGTGGDITIGTLRTCATVICGIGDTGEVSITTVLGDILAQSGQVNVTADTAVLNAQGDIGSPDVRFVFDGMVIDVPRISLTFTGEAYVDTRGIFSESNQAVDDLSSGGREAASKALAVGLDDSRREDVDEAAEESSVYEIEEEGVRAPSSDDGDEELANLDGRPTEAVVPLSQLRTR